MLQNFSSFVHPRAFGFLLVVIGLHSTQIKAEQLQKPAEIQLCFAPSPKKTKKLFFKLLMYQLLLKSKLYLLSCEANKSSSSFKLRQEIKKIIINSEGEERYLVIIALYRPDSKPIFSQAEIIGNVKMQLMIERAKAVANEIVKAINKNEICSDPFHNLDQEDYLKTLFEKNAKESTHKKPSNSILFADPTKQLAHTLGSFIGLNTRSHFNYDQSIFTPENQFAFSPFFIVGAIYESKIFLPLFFRIDLSGSYVNTKLAIPRQLENNSALTSAGFVSSHMNFQWLMRFNSYFSLTIGPEFAFEYFKSDIKSHFESAAFTNYTEFAEGLTLGAHFYLETLESKFSLINSYYPFVQNLSHQSFTPFKNSAWQVAGSFESLLFKLFYVRLAAYHQGIHLNKFADIKSALIFSNYAYLGLMLRI